jgi:hypothetical protein
MGFEESDAIIKPQIFLPMDNSVLFAELDAIVSALPDLLKQLGFNFRANMLGADRTLSIPFSLAATAVHQQRFGQLLTAERIRALKRGEDGEAARRRGIKENARHRFAEELQDPEATTHLRDNTVYFLEHVLDDPQFSAAARELLRQGIVLTWGAFEVLANDVFILLMNSRPELVMLLMDNESTKRLFHLKALSLEDLAEHNFDIRNKMGNILCQDGTLNGLDTIKSTLRVLFDYGAEEPMSVSSMWLLYQRRNLVVHRRGIVDAAYQQNTGDTTTPLGQELEVTAQDIEKYLGVVTKAGASILSNAVKVLTKSAASAEPQAISASQVY